MKKEKCKYTSIGGSALIEGVMMRSDKRTAIAVRRADGDIVLKVSENKKPLPVIPKIPILRGIVNFVMSMKISYDALMYAAEIAMDDVDEQPQSKLDLWLEKFLGKNGLAILGAVAMILGVVLGVGLFLALPTFIVSFVTGHIPGYADLSESARRIITSVGEGVIKMAVFLCYLLAISAMKDIRRVFEYHGAEHKSIFCFEKKAELTPDNAGACRRFHPRCGTSFLFLTLLVSIILSAFITVGQPLLRAAIRIAFLPIMMGLAYECIRLAGRYDNVLTRILSAPGLWFQHLTTKEPDESQLEVAIAALEGVLRDYPLDEQIILPKEEQQ